MIRTFSINAKLLTVSEREHLVEHLPGSMYNEYAGIIIVPFGREDETE